MAGIATDSKDNVWVIHRAAGVTLKKACCKAAPVVMQFDPSGRLLQSWEGPGDGYEWPLPNNERGIFIDQQYLYVSNQADEVIVVLDRQTLVEVGSCGRLGRQAGQFVSPHNIATDSKGNLYVAEDLGGARLQKFVLIGAGQ
jgi:DNA-binding beta-propeller fold protein YncE